MAFSPIIRAKRPIRWNCRILGLIVPRRSVVLIRDPKKNPSYLGLPGGGDKEHERTPQETAEQEFFEETGIDVRKIAPGQKVMERAFSEERRSRSDGGTHEYHLFACALDWQPAPGAVLRSVTGEIPEMCGFEDFLWQPEFHPKQREFLTRRDVLEGIQRAFDDLMS